MGIDHYTRKRCAFDTFDGNRTMEKVVPQPYIHKHTQTHSAQLHQLDFIFECNLH